MVQQGIDEEIINQKLENELTNLDSTFHIGKESIDVEEEREFLSSYISSSTRRVLKFVRKNENDDSPALINQIRMCHSVISIILLECELNHFSNILNILIIN